MGIHNLSLWSLLMQNMAVKKTKEDDTKIATNNYYLQTIRCRSEGFRRTHSKRKITTKVSSSYTEC